MTKQKTNSNKLKTKLIFIVLLGIILGISCLFSSKIESVLGIGNKNSGFVSSDVIKYENLTIHYLDVGQADSTLICLPDKTTMLIDAGLSSSADKIISYLNDLNISTIDYFILTHSDNDHSGGAKKIFNAFEIKNVYRPFQIACDKNDDVYTPIDAEKLGYLCSSEEEIFKDKLNIITTASYKNFITATYSETYLEAGQTKNAKVYVTNDGMKIESTKAGINFNFEFFAPLIRPLASEFNYETTRTYGYPTKFYGTGITGNSSKDSKSKNDASPVMLLEYKGNSFLFTGDATTNVETDLLGDLQNFEKERFNNISVYQAGHHGSKSSNSQEFLNLITPKYYVVSCKEGEYSDLPAAEVLERYENMPHSVNDYLLRTDKVGNIVFGFDDGGNLVYTAFKTGTGITVYWWEIAVGIFIVLSITILSVKFTNNKVSTAKRFVKTAEKVSKKLK